MTKARFATGVLAAAAMALPIAIFSLLAVFSPSVPGYDPLWSYVSVLALGSMGWIGKLFFALGAVALITFAASIWRVLPPSRDSRSAAAFFLLAAACVVVLIFVNIDHADGVWTLKRAAHWSIVGLAGIAFAAGAYFITVSIKRLLDWRAVYRFTVIISILTAVAALALSIAFHKGLVALLERLLLGGATVWIEVMSARVLQLSMTDSQSAEAR